MHNVRAISGLRAQSVHGMPICNMDFCALAHAGA